MLSKGFKNKNRKIIKKSALFKINFCIDKTGYFHGQGEQI